MGAPAKFSKPVLLTAALVLLCFSALSVTFYAGVITETDISKSMISDRWMGVSGTVERGENPLSGYDVGTLSLEENQTGNVLTAELEGIKGGGYYLAFVPGNVTEADPEQLSNLTDKSLLEKNGLFSKELFPGFYPDYSGKFDSPERTFETGKEIKIDGEMYNASYANLSGSGDMYLLRYSTGGEDVPVFVSPVDGLRRGSSFEDCYVSGCNFQALLPRLDGSEFSYSVNIYSRGEAVTGCGEVEGNTTSVVIAELDSQDNCLEVVNPGSYVDFYNSDHSGDEAECGVRVAADNATLVDIDMENFDSAVCIRNDADAEIMQGNLSENTVGVSVRDSNATVSNVTLVNSGTAAIDVQGSGAARLRNVSVSGTPIYGEAEEVSIKGYAETLPRPSGISDDMEPVGSRIEVLSRSNDSRVEDLGLGFPDLNTSKINPTRIYKYDEVGGSYQMTELDADLISVDWGEQRYARYSGTIQDFSVFSLYGEDITGEEDSGGQSPEEEDDGSDSGGGSSGGGGATGGGGGPSFQPTPEPAKINLSLEEELFNAKKGDTISVEFTANNTGTVAAENVTVGLDSDWSSVPKTFQVVRPNESRSGTVLVTVPEDAPDGNITRLIEAQFAGSTLDTEQFTVNVSEVTDTQRINVVEAPPFLSLETSTRRTVGVQVENPTNRPINNIEARFRGDSDCAVAGNQTYTVPAQSTTNVQVELSTADEENVCNDALVFTADDEILGFAPMRIELERPSNNIVSISLYVLLLLGWTTALVWRLKTRDEDQGDRFI